jgi:hypothetical protein
MLLRTVQNISDVLRSVVHTAALLVLFCTVVLLFVMSGMLLLLLRLLRSNLWLLCSNLRLWNNGLLLWRSRRGYMLSLRCCYLLFQE